MPSNNALYPAVDPNLYVVGMDAELWLGAGAEGGANAATFLLQTGTWQLEGTFADEQEQPPGNQLVQSVVTGVSFRLSLTESVIRTGDQYLLQQVMQAIYDGQVPQFSFQGRIGTRQVTIRRTGQQSVVSVCTIDFCQPTGAFDLMNVRPGGILRRALNFNVNAVPHFSRYL